MMGADSPASNPETGPTSSNGTVSYTYYNNGNLYTRTDPNGTVATITYDGVNRPTGITYTTASPAVATPSVQYTYDKNSVGSGFTGFVGALSSVSSSASKMEYSYDGFGRIVASRQTTNGTPYTFSSYQYSLTDKLTGLTYPSGRAISMDWTSLTKPPASKARPRAAARRRTRRGSLTRRLELYHRFRSIMALPKATPGTVSSSIPGFKQEACCR